MEFQVSCTCFPLLPMKCLCDIFFDFHTDHIRASQLRVGWVSAVGQTMHFFQLKIVHALPTKLYFDAATQLAAVCFTQTLRSLTLALTTIVVNISTNYPEYLIPQRVVSNIFFLYMIQGLGSYILQGIRYMFYFILKFIYTTTFE